MSTRGTASPGEITRLLDQLSKEDQDQRRSVLNELMPLIYSELKALARARRYRWPGDFSPGTTSLVHEAYARLAEEPGKGFRNRRQFFSVASKAMRSILIDSARWHLRTKRGGGVRPMPLKEGILVSVARCEELLALDEALGRLDESESELAEIVEHRCFGGLSVEETADVLSVSPSTVKRRWRLARAWLYRELQPLAP